jgi:DNA (cytosine-5)-methyltransferase 1
VAYPQQAYDKFIEDDIGTTLKACGGSYGGGSETLVAETSGVHYIVRRLTPTECARLQGFPDKWGHPDIKEALTDEEYAFWLEVRNTHAGINGKAVKDYTREQMLSWYNKLHTDSAEYKMWGNGIALPTALYVMQGISEVLNNG